MKAENKNETFERRRNLDLKIEEFLGSIEQEVDDLVFFSQKDRMVCYAKKKKDYLKGLNKIRKKLDKIEKLANKE